MCQLRFCPDSLRPAIVSAMAATARIGWESSRKSADYIGAQDRVMVEIDDSAASQSVLAEMPLK
jgi:hypothetical protein